MTEPDTTAQVRVGQVWEDRFSDRFRVDDDHSILGSGLVFGHWTGNRSGADHLRIDTLLGGEFTLVKEAPE